MKISIVKRRVVLLAGVLLALCGCATSGAPGVEQTAVMEAPGGVIIVDTFTTIARVSAVDAAKRKVTLVRSDGKKTVYKAGPGVVNFDQIRVGDMVRVVLTEEAAVAIGRGGPASSKRVTGAALAPRGAKPAGVVVDTMQVTANVVEVDAKARKVTFEFPDGSTRKVKAGNDVDLSAVRPGDNVTVQVTEGLAVTVEKP